MLRHFLKRIRNATELTKSHCRKLMSEENSTTSSGEVWDDPWGAAASKLGVVFRFKLITRRPKY